MPTKRNRDPCTGGKGCIICGKRGQAKLSGEFWLCCEHAHEVPILSFMSEQAVMEAVRGESRFLLVPTSVISKNCGGESIDSLPNR